MTGTNKPYENGLSGKDWDIMNIDFNNVDIQEIERDANSLIWDLRFKTFSLDEMANTWLFREGGMLPYTDEASDAMMAFEKKMRSSGSWKLEVVGIFSTVVRLNLLLGLMETAGGGDKEPIYMSELLRKRGVRKAKTKDEDLFLAGIQQFLFAAWEIDDLSDYKSYSDEPVSSPSVNNVNEKKRPKIIGKLIAVIIIGVLVVAGIVIGKNNQRNIYEMTTRIENTYEGTFEDYGIKGTAKITITEVADDDSVMGYIEYTVTYKWGELDEPIYGKATIFGEVKDITLAEGNLDTVTLNLYLEDWIVEPDISLGYLFYSMRVVIDKECSHLVCEEYEMDWSVIEEESKEEQEGQ